MTQPILAQMGRTGGILPGRSGGGHGKGKGSFCNFGRKYDRHAWILSVSAKASIKMSAKDDE